MKKFLAMFACLIGVFAVSNVEAACGGCNTCATPCCDTPCDQPCGECYCKYVHYQACPYTVKQCVCEQVPCPRRCCRYVPQYYQVQRCRYVPEYYSVQCCRQVPEYYEVCDYKTRRKTICIPQCRYVPRFYWKQECGCANQTPCC